jgi:hypothetical protein
VVHEYDDGTMDRSGQGELRSPIQNSSPNIALPAALEPGAVCATAENPSRGRGREHQGPGCAGELAGKGRPKPGRTGVASIAPGYFRRTSTEPIGLTG